MPRALNEFEKMERTLAKRQEREELANPLSQVVQSTDTATDGAVRRRDRDLSISGAVARAHRLCGAGRAAACVGRCTI